MTQQLRIAALAVVLVVPATVSAQEYCVTCAEPNVTYRCVISGARPGLSQSLQVFCLTALAKDGGHATCAIKRGVTVFECNGPVKTVEIGAEAPPGAAVPAAVIPPPAVPPADPKAPPKTVLEAAQRAQRASDVEMRKVGEATSDFFKRTFTCLGSLFTKCGESNTGVQKQ